MNEWINEQMNNVKSEWMNEWFNKWMNEGWVNKSLIKRKQFKNRGEIHIYERGEK